MSEPVTKDYADRIYISGVMVVTVGESGDITAELYPDTKSQEQTYRGSRADEDEQEHVVPFSGYVKVL